MSNIVTAQKLDKEQKNAFIAMMTEAFTHNPFIATLLHDDRQKIEALIRLTSSYYLKKGAVEIMYDDARRPVAAAILAPVGTPTMSIGHFIRAGLLGTTLRTVRTLGRADVNRLFGALEELEKHEITEPHCYLYMLGSVQKGCGRQVMNHVIDRYAQDSIMYWESSVAPNDHEYYRSFGATMYDRADVVGVDNGFFRMGPLGHQ